MKKTLYLFLFLCLPAFSFAQNTKPTLKKEVSISIIQKQALKKIEPLSINPIEQTKSLHYLKTTELISVKSYIKALKLKRREAVLS